MRCPKCTGDDVVFTTESVPVKVSKNRGFGFWLCLILFFPLSLLFMSSSKENSNETRSVAICKNCGYKWYV